MSYKEDFERKLFFRFLLTANTPGVYALINEKDKRILIHSSQNVMKAMGALIAEVANGTHKNKQLVRDRQHLRILLLGTDNKLKHMSAYQEQGYSLYNTEKIPRYSTKIVLLQNGLLELRLVTAGKRVYRVKRFKSEIDCEKYLRENDLWALLKRKK